MKTTAFLNTNIQVITQHELLKELKKGVVITPNVDHLVKLQKDKEFYEVYSKLPILGYPLLDGRQSAPV